MKELNPNKPVQLRDGRQIKNICWDYQLSRSMKGISAIIRSKDGSRDYWQEWTMDGKVYLSANTIISEDLINVPERIQGWINVYGEGAIVQFHETKEMADKYASKQGRIACIKINYTVGEGLE